MSDSEEIQVVSIVKKENLQKSKTLGFQSLPYLCFGKGRAPETWDMPDGRGAHLEEILVNLYGKPFFPFNIKLLEQ